MPGRQSNDAPGTDRRELMEEVVDENDGKEQTKRTCVRCSERIPDGAGFCFFGIYPDQSLCLRCFEGPRGEHEHEGSPICSCCETRVPEGQCYYLEGNCIVCDWCLYGPPHDENTNQNGGDYQPACVACRRIRGTGARFDIFDEKYGNVSCIRCGYCHCTDCGCQNHETVSRIKLVCSGCAREFTVGDGYCIIAGEVYCFGCKCPF